MATRSARTERLTILVTPEEREGIAARAAALKTTSSDVVRLAFEAFEAQLAFTPEQENELEAMAKELVVVAERTRRNLDEAIAETRATLAELRAGRQVKRAA